MMKVFLVDDEIVIREGIRNSFPWEESGYALCGEAPDGEIALPMIRDAAPDILITDIRMPFMDGMELCREVKRLMPWVGVVILSGYDDFEYARQAIALGVKEYLVKPISAKELKEALDKVSQRLAEERRERENLERMQRRYLSGNRFVKEKLLSALLMDMDDSGSSQSTLEQMRGLGINLAANGYAVMDLAYTAPEGKGQAVLDSLYALAENSGGIVHLCGSKHGALALILGDTETDTEERVYAFANSAVHELELSGCEEMIASIGEIAMCFAAIPQSFRSARHIRHVVAAREPLCPRARIVGVRELGDIPNQLPNLDIRPLREKLQYIEPYELPQAFEDYLSSLGAADIHSSMAADYLRVEALMTAACIVRESGGDPKTELDLSWRELSAAEGEQVVQAALRLLQIAVDFRAAHNPTFSRSSIARALNYLARHFSDPNLMLQDVAREAAMSNSRLSTVFAQEMGYTFTEYLTALRIGKAKELLSATDMRSSQIAFEVGYNDPHYFSYLFKKSAGMTPSEYRKQEKENQQK